MTWFPGSGAAGVNVTTLPFTARSPATSPDNPFTITCVPAASVVTSIGSLYVIVIVVLGDTFVAFSAGRMVTVGRTVSATALAPVVKLLVTPTIALPARSQNPLNATAYCVDVPNDPVGVNVSCSPSVL